MESLIKEKAKYQVEKSVYETGYAFMQFTKWGRILFLVFLIGIVPVYALSKYISIAYFDTVYKSLRLSSKPSTVLASPLTISPVEVFRVTNSIYSARAVIKNPNLDIAVGSSPVRVDFYDSAGSLIYTATDTYHILPNGEYDVVVPRIETTSAIVDAKINADNPHFQKRLNIPKVDFQTPTPEIVNNGSGGVGIEGTVYNGSPFALKKVLLKVYLFDASNKLIAVSSRTENSMKPFERRAYHIVWPAGSTAGLYRVETKADTNVLDPENLRLSTVYRNK